MFQCKSLLMINTKFFSFSFSVLRRMNTHTELELLLLLCEVINMWGTLTLIPSVLCSDWTMRLFPFMSLLLLFRYSPALSVCSTMTITSSLYISHHAEHTHTHTPTPHKRWIEAKCKKSSEHINQQLQPAAYIYIQSSVSPGRKKKMGLFLGANGRLSQPPTRYELRTTSTEITMLMIRLQTAAGSCCLHEWTGVIHCSIR